MVIRKLVNSTLMLIHPLYQHSMPPIAVYIVYANSISANTPLYKREILIDCVNQHQRITKVDARSSLEGLHLTFVHTRYTNVVCVSCAQDAAVVALSFPVFTFNDR